MTKTQSFRLPDDLAVRVEKWRRRFSQPSTSAALLLLLREKLRQEEYAFIGFRDSPLGREAWVPGTGMAVWEVAMVARAFQVNAKATARHLELPERLIQAALNYAGAFPEEIGAALAENDAADFEALRRTLPGLQRVIVPAEDEIRNRSETIGQ